MAPDIVRWGITRARTSIAIDAATSAPPSSSRPLLGRPRRDDTATTPSDEHDAAPERPALGRHRPGLPDTSRLPRRASSSWSLNPAMSGEAGELLGARCCPASPRAARRRSRSGARGRPWRTLGCGAPGVAVSGSSRSRLGPSAQARVGGTAARRGPPGRRWRWSARAAWPGHRAPPSRRPASRPGRRCRHEDRGIVEVLAGRVRSGTSSSRPSR